MTKMNQISIQLILRLWIYLISCTNLTVKQVEQYLNTQFMKSKILQNGRFLLEICKSIMVRILNGRTFDDTIGNFTI